MRIPKLGDYKDYFLTVKAPSGEVLAKAELQQIIYEGSTMMSQHFKYLLTQGVLYALLFATTHLDATIFTVTNTSDAVPLGPVGSLRAAIQAVNAGLGGDTIVFDIPASGPGYDPTTNTWTIKPVQDLDAIRKQVIINGYSPQYGVKPQYANRWWF